jgi:hypothetical protein
LGGASPAPPKDDVNRRRTGGGWSRNDPVYEDQQECGAERCGEREAVIYQAEALVQGQRGECVVQALADQRRQDKSGVGNPKQVESFENIALMTVRQEGNRQGNEDEGNEALEARHAAFTSATTLPYSI